MPARPDLPVPAPGTAGPRPEVVVVRDTVELAERAAALFAREVQAAVGARRRFLVGLSGGSTPSALYRLLAGPRGDRLPWDSTHLLWGDERCVPPDDERSNHALVERSGLLGRTLAGVYRMRGEDPPETAALGYEAVLTRLEAAGSGRRATAGPPALVMDLVLLGLGEDGHTASLFPGSSILLETHRSVAATEPYAGLRRLTLTLPMLRSARRVLFLVAGEGKREAVSRVLRLRDPGLPATQVAAGLGRITWMMDRAAAGGGSAWC